MFDKAKWSKEYIKRYRQKPEYKIMKQKWDKTYYKKHLEERIEYNKKAYKELKKDKLRFLKERERKRISAVKNYRKTAQPYEYARKMLIIETYGGKCKCCGITRDEFLAVDHIDGHGNEHRRKLGIKGGRHFYDWIIKNNFPKGFQILCHNCNFAKDHYEGGCPHTRGDVSV